MKNVTKFIIVYLLAVCGMPAVLCIIYRIVPKPEMISYLLGYNVIFAIIAYLFVSLITKKGKTPSASLFGLIIFTINIMILVHKVSS